MEVVKYAVLALAVAVISGCGGGASRGGVDPHLDRAYPEKLSEWRLFTATRPVLKPNAGVLVYQVNTPLFSDYASKFRTVWMPAGQAAGYNPDAVFALPIGTILSKTFSFPQKDSGERLIETRLLVRQASGWIALVYIWNREQTEALLDTAPPPVPVSWVDGEGREHRTEYSIPNVNQCTVCHDGGSPLGIKARHLNREDQLAQWTHAGYLSGAPDAGAAPRLAVWNNASTGSLNQRASAYLEVNCGTCHRAGTRAAPLDPRKTSEIPRSMETLDPAKRMPSLGHTVVHREAVELIRQWASAQQ